MALLQGTRLGSYEVLSPLGSGGMGEVYRARDTRLGRDVALKVLPAERLSDLARRSRFTHEARAASSLNHPHIVTIHEIESAEGIDFIVMELVPGKTLDALIPRQGMRLGEALRIAIPLADALAAAHAAGVVHRDFKPANVMVTPDGVVKVLDFGLAKLVRADTVDSEERTATAEAGARPVTRPGTVAGTTAYMSPEQARGEAVDARTDVFAFGAVMYEMVTGRRAFSGTSSAETLAAVLKEQPKPPHELVPEVPRDLERIILHCLRKEPGRRFQHMVDVKVELEELREESDSEATTPGAVPGSRSRRRWMALAAAGVLIVAAAALLTLWRLRPPEAPPPTVVRLTSERWAGSGSFSPEGIQIAYGSAGEDGTNWDIWLKIVGEAEARRLTTDPASEDIPAWSPDGKQIAFLRYDNLPASRTATYFDAGVVHLVSPLGGPARRLSDFLAHTQLSWSPDGRWLAAAKARGGGDPPGGIHLVPVGEGGPRPLTFPKAPAFDVSPAFSPGGRRLAYASCGGAENSPTCDVHVLSFDTELRPRGAARRLTRQESWMAGLTWTRDERWIIYGGGDGLLWRVRSDGTAAPERLDLVGHGGNPSAAASRDRLAFRRGYWHVGIFRLRLGSAPTPLIESALEVADYDAQYSPDGRRIAFQSNRGVVEGSEVWLAGADGSSPARLTRGPGRAQASPRWSPDGRSIAFASQAGNGHWDVWTIGVDGSGLRQVTRNPADEITPSWSRDGRHLYFTSNRSGRREVWRIAAAGGTEVQVTHDGGCTPHESRDGRTLIYMKVDSDGPVVARPTDGGEERMISSCVSQWSYAVGPEGVFHVDCSSPGTPTTSRRVLRLWDTATGEDRPVATFEADYIAGLGASPDGQTILYGRSPWGAGDLMMIDNFR